MEQSSAMIPSNWVLTIDSSCVLPSCHESAVWGSQSSEMAIQQGTMLKQKLSMGMASSCVLV